MRFITRVIIFSILLTIIVALQYFLGPENVSFYNRYIFQPFQAFRNWLLKGVPFSVGDLLYILLGVSLLYFIVRLVMIAFKWRKRKHELPHRLMQFLKVVAIMYLWFFLGWGGNYFKKPIAAYWNLDSVQNNPIKTMVSLDSFLVVQLNELAPQFKEEEWPVINKQAKSFYKTFTADVSRFSGLQVKASLFGFYMQHMAIQGYYNPFTGEAQINKYLPSFMLPFVSCHEMAHQSGIASEEDANLLAYALGRTVPNASFNYSAFFNLWLYTNNRMRQKDSSLARSFEQKLNPLSQKHLQELKEIRKQYQSPFQDWMADVYDGFLKLNRQKDGLRSYSRVIFSAWSFEQKREHLPLEKLMLP